jgi:protein SCO1/2
MAPRVIYWAVGVLAVVLGVGVALFGIDRGPKDPSPDLLGGTVLFGQERLVSPFDLLDHTGSAYNTERLKGRWTVMFFGYMHCPDVCPMTLSTLAATAKQLEGKLSDETLEFSFVSIDPERDTVTRLAEYVPFFYKSFVGVTGTKAELDKLVRSLGAIYSLGTPEDGSDEYIVDHSSRLLLIDPKARLTAILSDRGTPEMIATDLQTILKAYSS